jgi:hypothetical protein
MEAQCQKKVSLSTGTVSSSVEGGGETTAVYVVNVRSTSLGMCSDGEWLLDNIPPPLPPPLSAATSGPQ